MFLIILIDSTSNYISFSDFEERFETLSDNNNLDDKSVEEG